MNYVNLYRCGHIPPSYSNNPDTDGVNIYRHKIVYGDDHYTVSFYKYEMNGDQIDKFMSVVTIWGAELRLESLRYRFINGKVYVVMIVSRNEGRIALLIQGDKIINETERTAVMYNGGCRYRVNGGYFSNVIGREHMENIITEYFIDPIKGKICNQSYEFSASVMKHSFIISTETHISYVCHNSIETIRKSEPEVRYSLAMPGIYHKFLLYDGKHAYISGVEKHTLSIHNPTTFEKIADIREYGKIYDQHIYGDIDGFIICNVDWTIPTISFIIDNRGQIVKITGKESFHTLHATSYGKITSLDGIYQFKWEWRYYRLQSPNIRQLALCILMVLKRFGVDRHNAMRIGTLALSP